MAKKKQDLTPEERLAAALVPEEEWPYALPDGWKWVYLGGVIDWTSGGTPSRKHPEYYNGDIPWVKTGELDNGYIDDTTEKITTEAIQKSSAKILPVHTVLLAMYGATIGQVAILRVRAATNQACACGICSDLVYFKFLFYFLRSQKQNFINLGKGGAQPNISQAIIKKCKMPLVSLDEQRRLVLRIESLFAKLDAAREKIQSVLDSHETRKAALLHDAFTGKLTARWREEHQTELRESKQFPSKLKSAPNHANALAGKWALVRLGDVVTWSSGGTPSRKHPEYYSGDIPWVKTGELNNTYIYDTSEKITKDAIAQSSAKMLPVNTVLLAMYGATIGKVGILGVEAATNQACACGICSEWVDYRFLFYYLQSQKSSFIRSGKGGAQPNISQTIIKQYDFPLPSLLEQQEIARILDRLLAREQRARQAAEETLAAIDRMKQSILARAFRGEL